MATKMAPSSSWLPGLEGLELEKSVKPFLRWAGGKTRLMPSLLPHFPGRFKNYYEPFLGAGSVFFTVRQRATGRAFLSDLNGELINVWKIVREQPDDFLHALTAYVGRDSEADYYLIRSETPINPIARAARFFYLNQTSWNSLWRVNRWGVFNVPWGARPFRGIDRSTILDISSVLVSTDIEELDFREALKKPRRGDFVYLDPPYLPVSDTSKFAGYTETRFRLASLADLAAGCEDLSRRGVMWVLSNRDTSTVRELFSFANVIRLTTRRSVAAQNRRDVEPSASPEVIITGSDYKK
jgi:DNA adenine methylase